VKLAPALRQAFGTGLPWLLDVRLESVVKRIY
jgi:hypothetical protein